jgi:hypothetical protein
MTWDKFIEEMNNWVICVLDSKGFIDLKHETDVKPRRYLEFADNDLKVEGDHGLINSLSNSKRAIDCQITNLLKVLGFKATGNIHTRIKKLEEIDVLAPRILKKVNKIRNLLEHEFYLPTISEAEDAVDIATLFIEATDKVFISFMDSWWVARSGSQNDIHIIRDGNKSIIDHDLQPENTFSDGLFIQFDKETKDFGLWGYIENCEVFYGEVKKSSDLHKELLKYAISNDHTVYDFDEDKAAMMFLAKIRGKDGVSL